MKKLGILLTISAVLISGALFHSCQKENGEIAKFRETKNILKSETSLNLTMLQLYDIGDVEIYADVDEFLNVVVTLDESAFTGDLEGFEIYESHLYVGTDIPASNDPTQYPYQRFVIGLDDPLVYAIELSDFGDYECDVPFSLYFAFHAVFKKSYEEGGVTYYLYEDAWITGAPGAACWQDDQGNCLGWGEYFPYEITIPCPYICPRIETGRVVLSDGDDEVYGIARFWKIENPNAPEISVGQVTSSNVGDYVWQVTQPFTVAFDAETGTLTGSIGLTPVQISYVIGPAPSANFLQIAMEVKSSRVKVNQNGPPVYDYFTNSLTLGDLTLQNSLLNVCELGQLLNIHVEHEADQYNWNVSQHGYWKIIADFDFSQDFALSGTILVGGEFDHFTNSMVEFKFGYDAPTP